MNLFNTKILFIMILSIIFINNSCEMKRDALGADNEIRIICSELDQHDIENYLQMMFKDTLFTPEPEPFYFLRFSRPDSYDRLKKQAQVVVAAIHRDVSNPGYVLMKKILSKKQFEETENNDPVILAKNVYSKNQLFMVINASTKEKLLKDVETKRNYIRKHFDIQFRERQSRFLFHKRNRNIIVDSLKLEFGWTLNLPWGWDIIKKVPDSNFVWLGNEMPYQWIGIGWNKGRITGNNLEVGNYIWDWPKQNYKYIRFSDYRFDLKNTTYNNYNAWRATGLWETIDIMEAKGGPFRSYVFYDSEQDMTYHLNYLIHYPGNNKTIFFRQADLILKSFKLK